MELPGALTFSDNSIRVVPHGKLYDHYQREEVLCPGLLSFAAGVLKRDGGFRVEVRNNLGEFDQLLDCERYWIARWKWRDLNSPYLRVRDPVPWKDNVWLIRECEMTVLAWLRANNDPDAWNIPGLKAWLRWRDEEHINKLGREEYTKQYRTFWNRDFPMPEYGSD